MELAGGRWQSDGPPPPGKSLVGSFRQDITSDNRRLWWFHEGNKAYRDRDWKVVAANGQPWELYDLSSDRAEVRNLAADFPDRLSSMTTAWEKEAASNVRVVKSKETP